MQSADAFHETGSTALAWLPHPSPQEIASDPQFRVREIATDVFEAVWQQADCGNAVGNTLWYLQFESTQLVAEHLQAIADRINTGIADTFTSRALVVFNLANAALSGVAVFRADMAWSKDIPLPPVVIRELNGDAVPSALTDWQEGPDRKGRADRRQVSFTLRFAAHNVPAQGWRTYVASYTAEAVHASPEALADETTDLTVLETLRHAGDYQPVGAWSAPVKARE